MSSTSLRTTPVSANIRPLTKSIARMSLEDTAVVRDTSGAVVGIRKEVTAATVAFGFVVYPARGHRRGEIATSES